MKGNKNGMTLPEACAKYTFAAMTYTILNQFLGALCFGKDSAGFAADAATKSAPYGVKLHDFISNIFK